MGRAPRRGPGVAARPARAGRRPPPHRQNPTGVDPPLVVGQPDQPSRVEPTLERRRHDATRRDARHLVLGRRTTVDDRQHSGIRHRPRLYNRPRGHACDSPSLNSRPGSAGSRSDPTSPSRERASTRERSWPDSSTSRSSPSATGTTSSGRRPRTRGARLPHRARNRSVGRRSSWGTPRVALMDLGLLARERDDRRRGRHHRIGRQDHHQGSSPPLPFVGLRGRRQRAVVQQRARVSRSRSSMRPTARAGWCSRWARAGWATWRAWLEVARPDVGIVTSVAMAHVEYFGDLGGRCPREERARARAASPPGSPS